MFLLNKEDKKLGKPNLRTVNQKCITVISIQILEILKVALNIKDKSKADGTSYFAYMKEFIHMHREREMASFVL